ncbi:hypothetical protein Emag_006754 [Eimeria magna]
MSGHLATSDGIAFLFNPRARLASAVAAAAAVVAAAVAAGFKGGEYGGLRSQLRPRVAGDRSRALDLQESLDSLLETFSAQLSGYGASQALVGAVLQEYQRAKRAKAKTLQAAGAAAAAATAPAAADDSSLVPDDLSKWTIEDALEFVKTFVKIRFPFVLVLNKCDAGGDVDKNVMKLATKFPGQPLVLTSALAECFLQKLQQQGMLYYDPGSGCAYHKEEGSGPGSCRLQAEQLEAIRALKPIDPKALHRLEKVRDLMLFRHGGTGVAEAIRIAVEVQGQRLPVYPVKTLQLSTPDKKGRGPFFECLLVKKGTT